MTTLKKPLLLGLTVLNISILIIGCVIGFALSWFFPTVIVVEVANQEIIDREETFILTVLDDEGITVEQMPSMTFILSINVANFDNFLILMENNNVTTIYESYIYVKGNLMYPVFWFTIDGTINFVYIVLGFEESLPK